MRLTAVANGRILRSGIWRRLRMMSREGLSRMVGVGLWMGGFSAEGGVMGCILLRAQFYGWVLMVDCTCGLVHLSGLLVLSRFACGVIVYSHQIGHVAVIWQ
ncbi:hypothetical protein P153DRAFT_391821 [Dothidotthia symphoricarpi CBS 119687]|uniref:Uncharacterized protein n=1 Tax=Dothidotthia symphoricarpi CBS 119687 TaxID=1392245 RepID=A0A6A6ARN3_9PLEO|nr:uncharacterized protein P153DRAFT_391821 [Dothidotthia symphoricarpi CBS 119687]KAF2134480.1 hypothetical protein P153DRAFT_391821 [Dothidotthia symphoricarpi CBS 119687]